MAARSSGQAPPCLDVDAVHDHIASAALHDGPVARVGLELEAHLVDLADAAGRPPWERVREAVGSAVLPGGSALTVEPGGQLELSSPPLDGVAGAVAVARADDRALRAHLRERGLGLVAVGADPLRAPQRVSPRPRYAAMEQHWRATGQASAGLAMMCSTAALQVNLDAGPASGWAARTELVHALGPVLVAVSATSPWLAGRRTGWRSTRQRVWGDLDVLRCGPLRGGPDPADEWARYALDAPVMLVPDGAAVRPVTTRVPLRDWVSGRVRLADRAPDLDDVDRHLTTLFPPARLRGWIEVRYLDAAPERWWPALAATLVTLTDVPAAADAALAATEPVRRRWTEAARDGLADGALHRAAQGCLAAAVRHVTPELRADVERLADLVAAGRSPGDELDELAGRLGPADAMLEEARA